jgi:hypothetical protein
MGPFRCSRCKGVVQQLDTGPPDLCPLCGTEIRPAVHVADWVVELGAARESMLPLAAESARPPSVPPGKQALSALAKRDGH